MLWGNPISLCSFPHQEQQTSCHSVTWRSGDLNFGPYACPASPSATESSFQSAFKTKKSPSSPTADSALIPLPLCLCESYIVRRGLSQGVLQVNSHLRLSSFLLLWSARLISSCLSLADIQQCLPAFTDLCQTVGMILCPIVTFRLLLAGPV